MSGWLLLAIIGRAITLLTFLSINLGALVEPAQRHVAPLEVLPLERHPAQQSEVRADTLGLGEVRLLRAAAQQSLPDSLVAGQLGRGPFHAFDDGGAHRL